MGAHARHEYIIHMLGCPSGALLPLRHTQVSAPQEDVRHLPAISHRPELPIFRGFDDVFQMPHSRHTEVHREDILANPDLQLIAESPDSGVSIVMARSGREFFITGHLEYAPNTLDAEYRRDKDIRDDVDLPKHYYLNDDPECGPLVTWRAHANLLYSNWINYYVYQETPYDINQIR